MYHPWPHPHRCLSGLNQRYSEKEKTSESNMSHVDVKNIEPTTFEDRYYDEYDYYNLTDKYTEGSSRKGRSKKEASENTNRPNPGGHERKIVEKFQNSEKKAKE